MVFESLWSERVGAGGGGGWSSRCRQSRIIWHECQRCRWRRRRRRRRRRRKWHAWLRIHALRRKSGMGRERVFRYNFRAVIVMMADGQIEFVGLWVQVLGSAAARRRDIRLVSVLNPLCGIRIANEMQWLQQQLEEMKSRIRRLYCRQNQTKQAGFADCVLDLVMPLGLVCLET